MIGIKMEAGVSNKTKRCKKTTQNLHGEVTKAGAKHEVVLALRSRTEVEVRDALNAEKMVTLRENVRSLVIEATLREIEADGDADVEAAIVLVVPEPAISVRKKVIWLEIAPKLVAMTGTETITETETRVDLTKDQGETMMAATSNQIAKKMHGVILFSKKMAGVHQGMPNGEINTNYI